MHGIDFHPMRKLSHHWFAMYALIVYMGIAPLIAQTIELHMHLLHDQSSPFAMADHTIGVHMAFLHPDTFHNNHHQDGIANHHSTETGINAKGIMDKTDLLSPVFLLFFVISILLYVPRIYRIRKKPDLHAIRPPGYYLLHPPLRAPPR